jgi:hypothetical protein
MPVPRTASENGDDKVVAGDLANFATGGVDIVIAETGTV